MKPFEDAMKLVDELNVDNNKLRKQVSELEMTIDTLFDAITIIEELLTEDRTPDKIVLSIKHCIKYAKEEIGA